MFLCFFTEYVKHYLFTHTHTQGHICVCIPPRGHHHLTAPKAELIRNSWKKRLIHLASCAKGHMDVDADELAVHLFVVIRRHVFVPSVCIDHKNPPLKNDVLIHCRLLRYTFWFVCVRVSTFTDTCYIMESTSVEKTKMFCCINLGFFFFFDNCLKNVVQLVLDTSSLGDSPKTRVNVLIYYTNVKHLCPEGQNRSHQFEVTLHSLSSPCDDQFFFLFLRSCDVIMDGWMSL